MRNYLLAVALLALPFFFAGCTATNDEPETLEEVEEEIRDKRGEVVRLQKELEELEAAGRTAIAPSPAVRMVANSLARNELTPGCTPPARPGGATGPRRAGSSTSTSRQPPGYSSRLVRDAIGIGRGPHHVRYDSYRQFASVPTGFVDTDEIGWFLWGFGRRKT